MCMCMILNKVICRFLPKLVGGRARRRTHRYTFHLAIASPCLYFMGVNNLSQEVTITYCFHKIIHTIGLFEWGNSNSTHISPQRQEHIEGNIALFFYPKKAVHSVGVAMYWSSSEMSNPAESFFAKREIWIQKMDNSLVKLIFFGWKCSNHEQSKVHGFYLLDSSFFR